MSCPSQTLLEPAEERRYITHINGRPLDVPVVVEAGESVEVVARRVAAPSIVFTFNAEWFEP